MATTLEQVASVRTSFSKVPPHILEAMNEVFWAAVVERIEALPEDMKTQALDHLHALWDLLSAAEETGEEEPSKD